MRTTTRRGARWGITALALATLTTLTAAAPGATPSGVAGSLPSVASGARPGPAVLYADPVPAPQLQNVRGWRAEPILVSGAAAYRDGEWLYQDFLLDDHGATGAVDPGDVYGPGDHLYSPTAGTFTYPTDPIYANNAADLVELRLRPVPDATAFRVTLNTLKDADRTAFTIALGGEAGTVHPWPHGAGVSSPAEAFLTVHGHEAELRDASGELVAEGLPVLLDRARRQIDVRLPHEAWDPGRDTHRVTIGVGLWDTTAGTYLAPAPGPASATTPGGGAPNGVAIVNVGPRFDEPWPDIVGATMGDTAATARATAPWWRERQQSQQLTLGDVSPFAAEVDFAKLADRVDDDTAVPTTGPMNRILASRFVFGQGVDPSKLCYDIGRFDAGAACIGRFVGQLQPYTIYVPGGPAPRDGYGLTLLLHSLSANHNQYAASQNQAQLGDRGAGSIVITPGGRGPDGFYAGVAEADTFEVWADVARRYELDPDWVTVSGYSMGGFGTYRLLARYPDLFARGFSVVGSPGSVADQLASLRHTPLLVWNAAGDELVNLRTAEDAHAGLVAAGIRHTYDLFLTADHLTLAGNDEYGPGADYLGEHRVDRDPARVTYVLDPREDNPDAGVVADHAYWLSGLELRDADAAPTGTIDVRSLASGEGEAEVLPVAQGAGVLTGGNLPALSFATRELAWTDAPSEPAADRLVVEATNIARVVVDVARAGVSCDVALEVTTDGPLDIVLAGCDRVVPVVHAEAGA